MYASGVWRCPRAAMPVPGARTCSAARQQPHNGGSSSSSSSARLTRPAGSLPSALKAPASPAERLPAARARKRERACVSTRVCVGGSRRHTVVAVALPAQASHSQPRSSAATARKPYSPRAAASNKTGAAATAAVAVALHAPAHYAERSPRCSARQPLPPSRSWEAAGADGCAQRGRRARQACSCCGMLLSRARAGCGAGPSLHTGG
jgi:hypothetical protein